GDLDLERIGAAAVLRLVGIGLSVNAVDIRQMEFEVCRQAGSPCGHGVVAHVGIGSEHRCCGATRGIRDNRGLVSATREGPAGASYRRGKSNANSLDCMAIRVIDLDCQSPGE